MRSALKALSGSFVLASLSVIGCSSDDSVIGAVPGIDTGNLVQNWTIEGQRETGKCIQYNADRMRVVVYDEDGSVSATEFAPCAAFELRLELRTRRYTGSATFIDVNGNPVSRTRAIPAFAVQDDQTLTQNLDFGAVDMTP